MLVFEGDAVGDYGIWGGADTDIDDSGDFPELENDAHSLREENHPTWFC